MVIRVGKQKNSAEKYTYKDVPLRGFEWVNADQYLPREYDICDLKMTTNIITRGWWTGQIWDGKKVKEDDIVKDWKRKQEYLHS